MRSRSDAGIGNSVGLKSPTVRLQTGTPRDRSSRISAATRRIWEPATPAALVEIRGAGASPAGAWGPAPTSTVRTSISLTTSRLGGSEPGHLARAGRARRLPALAAERTGWETRANLGCPTGFWPGLGRERAGPRVGDGAGRRRRSRAPKRRDRTSTRLNSSHVKTSYAGF